jgi:hypothetical protein
MGIRVELGSMIRPCRTILIDEGFTAMLITSWRYQPSWSRWSTWENSPRFWLWRTSKRYRTESPTLSVSRKENVCVFDYIARSHIGNATYYLTMPSMPPDTAKPDLFSMQTYYVESQAYWKHKLFWRHRPVTLLEADLSTSIAMVLIRVDSASNRITLLDRLVTGLAYYGHGRYTGIECFTCIVFLHCTYRMHLFVNCYHLYAYRQTESSIVTFTQNATTKSGSRTVYRRVHPGHFELCDFGRCKHVLAYSFTCIVIRSEGGIKTPRFTIPVTPL